jgi:hypothetical protein
MCGIVQRDFYERLSPIGCELLLVSQRRFLAFEGAVSFLERVCAFYALDGIGGLGSGCDCV